jgi:hypothetical protein
MTNDHTRDVTPDAAISELTDGQLEQVSGGTAVVAPRDAASGLATGRRMH